MYNKGCHDNYVGTNIKIIRTFFNWLAQEKDMHTGDFHSRFYVRKEEVPILVLSPEQLKFLIHNAEFHNQLLPAQQRIKDIFVFGCTTGLRYSDIFLLTNKNFEQQGTDWYVKLRSKKTKTFTNIKLPGYAVHIYLKYQPKTTTKPVFKPISLLNFNKHLKTIGEQAGFTAPVTVQREQQGKTIHNPTPYRFCDKMSSHMMRRTAITTLLILGMPEHLVRKISGHSHGSTAFNRYVHYAQAYMDKEIEKVYSKLEGL